MDLKNYFRTFTRKAATGLVFALALTLLTVSAVFAALHTIDTNNNSVSDWGSVPIYQLDDPDDYNTSCPDADGNDDIIETYVASGPPGEPDDLPTHLYFRVRTNGTNAVSAQYHWVAVYVDCGPYVDPPGEPNPPDGTDNNDVLIIYRGPADHVVYGDGQWLSGYDHPTPEYIIQTQYAQGGPEGERPANGTDTVEWGMPMDDYNVITQAWPSYSPNCGPNSQASIKFYTYKVTSGLRYDCTYDETEFGPIIFDIPTVVELNSLSAQATSGVDRLAISAAALLGAAAVGGLGLLLVHRRNQSA